MQYAQALLDSPKDESLETRDKIFELLWPIFERQTQAKEIAPKKRVLKSGKTGYQRPIANPDSASNRLISWPLPKATKSDRKAKREKEVGAKNNILADWLIRKDPGTNDTTLNDATLGDATLNDATLDDTTLDDVTLDDAIEPQLLLESPIVSNPAISEEIEDSVALCLASHQKAYLSASRERNPSKTKMARAQWKELDSAIKVAISRLHERCKKDKNLEFPSFIIENIIHLTASLSTAQSAIHRHSSSRQDGPPETRSGIYLARTIASQADYTLNCKDILITQNGNRTNHKSFLDNPNIRKMLLSWSAFQKVGEVTPLSFLAYTNNHVLPQFGITKKICRSTATSWMVKLGFTLQEYQKSMYFDGHERPDVVLARNKYIKDFEMYRKRSRTYGGENLDILCEVDPGILDRMRETNVGRLIHISDFILETTGRLELSEEQFLQSQSETGKKPKESDAATIIYPGSTGDKWWDMEQLCKQVSEKAIPIFETLHPDSQAVFIFDCSSAHGAFAKDALRVQNMNLSSGGKQSMLRDTVIPCDDPHIPPHLHGQRQTMVYDSSHPDPTLAGKAKGVQAVLEERGLWNYYTQTNQQMGKSPLKFRCTLCSTSNRQRDAAAQAARLTRQAEANGYFLSEQQCIDELLARNESSIPTTEQSDLETSSASITCCWSKILSQQSDFLNERPLLQSIIEDAGHACLFLLKFHCELNPIELFWSYIKQSYRKQSHTCSSFKACQALFNKVRQSCPVITIRRYFRRIDRQLHIYKQGYNGPQSSILMKKYTSHRCIPQNTATRINILTS
ncbi:hypothetical protein PTTG_25268 [Puccinia triticina 1-1 BBBD Race 1]|uniref:DDE-1 domain-containing protein n=1 Tax=Puccinia triticina (isolate 1-1 / race 1 (BBBD)) TaxID=630390 RepID=A0A180H4W9_PUCT1|nr:hypothetical protein PTTG_25268 [Puccinia triticina 1-1 BBBD Race 1]